MLIGNRQRLAIELQPLAPTWDRAYRPERTAWGALSIFVKGENLCRNVAAGEEQVRSGVNVPLAPIAKWLVEQWPFIQFEERPAQFPQLPSAIETMRRWGSAPTPRGVEDGAWVDSREEWWSRHFLLAGSEGACLPNLVLVRSADWLSIEWSPPRFGGDRAPEFLSRSGQELLPWAEAEGVLAEFVAFVARWLNDEGLGDLYEWVRDRDPLRDRETDVFRALAAYTGRGIEELLAITGARSIDELPTALGLPAGARDPAASVISQTVRDLPPTLSPGLAEIVRAMSERARGGQHFAPALRGVVYEAARTVSLPEDAGYEAAREARSRMGLDGQPIDDLQSMLADLSINATFSGLRCASERMLVGSREDGSAVVIVNETSRTEVPWGKRFELARALGYLFVAPYRDGALGGASSPFSQPWLRRCSGAFAAEFLLPGEALAAEGMNYIDDESGPQRFRRLMQKYGVGARTAAYQLWNRGFLSSAQTRDDLIDRFAAE